MKNIIALESSRNVVYGSHWAREVLRGCIGTQVFSRGALFGFCGWFRRRFPEVNVDDGGVVPPAATQK